jgi:hypothetical protein
VADLLEREQDPARRRAGDAGQPRDLAEGERGPLAREDLDDRDAALERLQRLPAVAVLAGR